MAAAENCGVTCGNAARRNAGLLTQDRIPRERQEQVKISVSLAKLGVPFRLSRLQKKLAKLVGTTQSVIARLEDADYQGHSLNMLGRIATNVSLCHP